MNPYRSDYEGVVVLGMPRSGTTLMRRLLNAHPRICCPPETNLLNACGRFLYTEPSANGILGGPFGGLETAPFSRQEVADRLRDFVFQFFRELAQREGKPRWAEKSAYDIFHLDAIEMLCALHCRFVCLVRHPLDVVCSLAELTQSLDRYMSELHEYVRRFPRPLEAMAHAWVDANERLLRFTQVHHDRCFHVVYEQFVEQPQAILNDLFEFLDEPTSAQEVIEQVFNTVESPGLGDWKTFQTKEVNAKSVGRWQQLASEDVNRLVPIVQETMEKVGYPPISLDSSSSAEEQRRYELFQMVAQMKSKAPKAEPEGP